MKRWCPDCGWQVEGDPMCCMKCGTGADHFRNTPPSPRRGGRRFGLTPDGPSPLLSVRIPAALMTRIDTYADRRGIKRPAATRELLERGLYK